MRGVRDEAQPRVDRTSEQQAPLAHGRRLVRVFLFAGFAALSTLLSPALSNDFDFTNSPEANQAQKLLEQKAPGAGRRDRELVRRWSAGRVPSSDPAFAEKVNAALDDLRALGPSVVLEVPSGYPVSEQDAPDPQVAALGPIDSEDGTAVSVHRDPHR